MPTGYTATIKDGISFNTFIMGCARGMGACATMRDEPTGKEIPDKFEPSDYNQKRLLEAQADLSRYQKFETVMADLMARQEFDDEIKAHKRRIEEAYHLKKQYTEMLKKVCEWQPPTPDHDGLKEFMSQQINSSIRFDCNTDYYHKPVFLSGRDWLSKKISQALHDVEYHTKENQEECDRTDSRNTWLKQLRTSIRT